MNLRNPPSRKFLGRKGTYLGKEAYVGNVIKLTRVITNRPVCCKYIYMSLTENGY